MAYTIIHNNPLIDASMYNPDVVVTYDPEKQRFYVTFVKTNTGYVVNRGDLVSEDFKFTDTIEREILSGCATDDELYVILTQRVRNEIYVIRTDNCNRS